MEDQQTPMQDAGESQGEIVSEVTPPETPEPTQGEDWKALLDKVASIAPKEELRKHPVLFELSNAEGQRIAGIQRKTWDKEQAQRVEEAQKAQHFLYNFDAMPPEQQLQVIKSDPAVLRSYERAQQVLSQGLTVDGLKVAKRIVDGFREAIAKEEDYADAPFEALEREHIDEPVEWFKSILDHADKKRRKKFEAELPARVQAELAKRTKGLENIENEPEFQPGGTMSRIPKTFAELEKAYGSGTATETETALYLKQRQERQR